MKRFWLTYLFVAALGTVAVYYITAQPEFLPLIANYLPQPPPMASTPSSVSVPASHSVSIRLAPAPAKRRPHVDKPVIPQELAPALAQALPPPDLSESVAAAEEPLTTPTTEPPAQPLYTPPPPNPDATSWCILWQQAPGYGADGKKRATFPAGTVGEISQRTPTANGDMAVCTVDVGGRWQGPVLIGLENLVTFEGPLSEAPPPALDLLYRYYTLKGKIDTRQAALQQKAANANPHAADCTRARTELQTFNARVKTLTAERDAASGPKRSGLINTLHGMQSQFARLRLQLEQAETQRKAWDAQHPRSPDGQRDPEIARWREELRQLKPEKQQYVP